MNKHLLAIAIGPVQDFIASARRTRDLWAGSYILSEVSKAAAKVLADAGVELIFPAPLNAADLASDSSLNVANKILAVMIGDNPSEVVDLAKEAVRNRWREFADATMDHLGSDRIAIDASIWEHQVNDVIEFYSSWVILLNEDSYREAREHVERLLAGRKDLRDFGPGYGCAGVPKSSLDGLRESVFRNKNHHGIRWYGIKGSEQLDAVGLTKRLSEGRQYPSVTRVAADPWIRRLSDATNREVWQQLLDICREELTVQRATSDRSPYSQFPFDATVLYENRLLRWADENVRDADRSRQFVQKMTRALNDISKEGLGRPSSYYALLLADGDRMGATLSKLDTMEGHQSFSRQLSSFAGAARGVVEHHHGVLVYSGGDDVLAFLPVDHCLSAASDLHGKFGELLGTFKDESGMAPTLSVGIAIGHCIEPLEDLLTLAREAEKCAKGTERNGLAVLFQTRSGGDAIRFRESWNADPVTRLHGWIQQFLQGGISTRAAYDIRKLAIEYSAWEDGVPEGLLGEEMARLLQRKRVDRRALPQNVMDLVKEELRRVNSADALLHFGIKLILARRLAQECVAAPASETKGDERA